MWGQVTDKVVWLFIDTQERLVVLHISDGGSNLWTCVRILLLPQQESISVFAPVLPTTQIWHTQKAEEHMHLYCCRGAGRFHSTQLYQVLYINLRCEMSTAWENDETLVRLDVSYHRVSLPSNGNRKQDTYIGYDACNAFLTRSFIFISCHPHLFSFFLHFFAHGPAACYCCRCLPPSRPSDVE